MNQPLRNFIHDVSDYFSKVEGYKSRSSFDHWNKAFTHWKGDDVTYVIERQGHLYSVTLEMRYVGCANIIIGREDLEYYEQEKFSFYLSDFGCNHKMFSQVAHKMIWSNLTRVIEIDTSSAVAEAVSQLNSALVQHINVVRNNEDLDDFEKFEVAAFQIHHDALKKLALWEDTSVSYYYNGEYDAFEAVKDSALKEHPFLI